MEIRGKWGFRKKKAVDQSDDCSWLVFFFNFNFEKKKTRQKSQAIREFRSFVSISFPNLG